MSGMDPAAVTVPLVEAEAAIVRVLWSSVAATVVVAVAFSCLILFLTRAAELRVAGRRGSSVIYGALSALSLGIFLAALVYGLILLTQKS